MMMAARTTRRSAGAARVEVLAGVGAFVVALVTWALQLFAPLYERDGSCISCRPRFGQVSAVDSMYGLNNLVHYFPSLAVLILAFLLLTGLVALGAYLHGVREVRAGRWLMWGASVLLALALPIAAYTMSTLIQLLPVHQAVPVQIVPGVGTLVLGLGLSVALAVLASLAAREQHAKVTEEGTTLPPPTRSRWAPPVGVLAGSLAFAVVLLTWGISLFAPLYQNLTGCDRFGCPHLRYVSLVEAKGGMGAFILGNPVFSSLIFALLILAGIVAIGAGLLAGRRAAIGRWLLRSGIAILPLIVSAMATLSLSSIFFLSATPVWPYQTWLGVETIAGTDLLALVVGPSLCLGLALVAAVAALDTAYARRQSHQ